jgi:putative DNA primase/helicase
MKRKKRTERVSRLRGRDTDAFRVLRQQACRWANDNIAALKDAKPVPPDALNDRAADNWEPLLAIADLAGGEWPTKARAAALALSGNDIGTASLGAQLLAAIRDLMLSLNVDRLASQAIADTLAKDEAGPWVAYGKAQKPINQRQVAKLLEPYGVRPDQIRIGAITKKGYLLAWLADAFEAYLDIPPVLSETTKQTADAGPNLHFLSETPDEPVSVPKCEKPNNDGLCFGVSDRKGGNGKIPKNEGEAASEPCASTITQACRHCGRPPDGTELFCSISGVEYWLHRECIDGWEAELDRRRDSGTNGCSPFQEAPIDA